MTLTVARLASLLLCAVAVPAAAACGKRGNPMPPLQRIPAAPVDVAVVRVDDQVYVRLTVPAANIDGVRPGDVARVELYALTLDREPSRLADVDPRELRRRSTLVGSEPVRPPEPAPPVAEATTPVAAGLDQGATVVFREVLSTDAHQPAALPGDRTVSAVEDTLDFPRPLAAPAAGAGPRRYYYAVAVSSRGRYGPHSGPVPAPLGPTSGAPSVSEIAVRETSVIVRWTAPADARRGAPAADPGLLPSRWLVTMVEPTMYDVYEAPANASPDGPLLVPTPLTSAPVFATEFIENNITLGAERCFFVRPVDVVDGIHVRGPASPVRCAAFADTFAPAPARDLVTVAVPGAINLIWEPSEARDVAGYLVLRAEAGGATLTPLQTTPLNGLSFRDETVRSGVRYVYAVVAVDRSGNRSGESNRVEETAR